MALDEGAQSLRLSPSIALEQALIADTVEVVQPNLLSVPVLTCIRPFGCPGSKCSKSIFGLTIASTRRLSVQISESFDHSGIDPLVPYSRDTSEVLQRLATQSGHVANEVCIEGLSTCKHIPYFQGSAECMFRRGMREQIGLGRTRFDNLSDMLSLQPI